MQGHMHVDNAAMQLVRMPRQLDLLLTENTFGDILSDCAAMVAGSIGLLPSASLGPARLDGTRRDLVRAAPRQRARYRRRGIANPFGAILSFALCLRHSLGRDDGLAMLEGAVEQAIVAGATTADIAQPGERAISTREMGDAVLRQLEWLAAEFASSAQQGARDDVPLDFG
jgi:3-isopropylmalate dehydrogenase